MSGMGPYTLFISALLLDTVYSELLKDVLTKVATGRLDAEGEMLIRVTR